MIAQSVINFYFFLIYFFLIKNKVKNLSVHFYVERTHLLCFLLILEYAQLVWGLGTFPEKLRNKSEVFPIKIVTWF